ncbi:MAG: DUF481 domain-containing protein [Candidatus Marinimicrobia bacterium]|nr:DUF481 domain-containing protein [Candidatus Neomarinimicrobiota bacterium]
MRKAELQQGTHFSLGINLAYMEGNSQIFQSRLKGRLDYIQAWGRLFLVANQKVSSKDEIIYINQGFAHLRAIKPLSSTMDVEFFLQQEYNEFISLKSRMLAGSGIRFNSQTLARDIDQPQNFSSIVGLGFMYEREAIGNDSDIFSGDPVHGSLAKLLRSTNYLVLRWTFSDVAILQSTSYYQVDVKRFADYRILSNSQLNLNLTQNLVINLNLNFRYDSEPPAHIQDKDLEFSQGLSYYFK